MDPEMQNILKECSVTVCTLLSLLEQDRQDMSNCVSGELFNAYCRGIEEATQAVYSIQKELRVLLEA